MLNFFIPLSGFGLMALFPTYSQLLCTPYALLKSVKNRGGGVFQHLHFTHPIKNANVGLLVCFFLHLKSNSKNM